MLVRLLSSLLLQEGHEVLKADNGIDAIDVIDNQKPDLVILDLLISFITGYEIINYIRSIQSTYIKIVVVSKVSLDNVITEAFQLGADDYVSLPLQQSQLMARIRRLSRYNLAEAKSYV